METVNSCEICGSREIQSAYSRRFPLLFYGEDVQCCRECGLLFLSPRMDEEELKKFYCTRFATEKCYQRARPEYQKLAEEHFDALKPYLKGRILEVGCGKGYLIRLLKQAGYDAQGTEIGNRSEVPIVTPSGRYDMVLLIHVLEHLRHPRRMLRELHDLPDRIYVEIPAYDLAKPHSGYHHSAHLYDFSRDHLKRLLQEEGWNISMEFYYKHHAKWYGIVT